MCDLSVTPSIYCKFEKQQKKHKHPIFCLLWKNSFNFLPGKLRIFLTMAYIEQKYWSSRYDFFKSTIKTGKNWCIIIIVSITRRILKLRGFIEKMSIILLFLIPSWNHSWFQEKKPLFTGFNKTLLASDRYFGPKLL